MRHTLIPLLWLELLMLGWLIGPTAVRAQLTLDQQRINASPYVYKLVIYSGKNEVGTMTAFKIAGYDGLLTALHGLTVPSVTLENLRFVAFRYSGYGDGKETERINANLKLQGINVAADLAFISYAGNTPAKLWSSKEGLKLAQDPVTGGNNVRVFGYPGVNILIGRNHETQAPAVHRLMELVTPESAVKLGQRKSPVLDQSVVNIGLTAIYSGDSGGPVFNMAGEVVGVANGGDFNLMRERLRSWAVLPKNIPVAEVSDLQKAEFRRLSGNGLQILMSESNPIEVDYNPIETPRITVGGTLSRPVWFMDGGVKGDWNFRNMNGRFDGYAEVKVGNRLLAGAYLSSRYLQYSVLKAFNYSIPLQAERTIRQAKSLDSYGVQLSALVARRVRSNSFVGAGFFPVLGNSEAARLRFNYRLFGGYRFYATPKRRLGLELRLMQVGQNVIQYSYRPTFGIARVTREIKPLTQWYVCGGLTYSVYRRE